MKYLVELVQKEQPEVPHDKIEYIISYLTKEGYLSYTVQYHYDIYDFYLKAKEHYKNLNLEKKCALIDTVDHFKISERHLYRIIKQFDNSMSVETN
jgi:AraC-like DNA-binding protein